MNVWSFGVVACVCITVIVALRQRGSALTFDLRGMKASVETVKEAVGPANGQNLHEMLTAIAGTLDAILRFEEYQHKAKP